MIKLESVAKSFGEKVVLRELTFEVKKNEILSLLGPNGCGKTTTLNAISGLSKPDEGNIFVNDVLVDGKSGSKTIHLTPSDRKVGYVFQTNALFPHMRILENVAYGIKAKHLPKREVNTKARSLLEFVGLREYAEYFPHQISGGQKQRAALARSLATDPEVLLLDEPISAVHSKLRESMRFEFKSLLRTLKITAIYVTHNLTEALVMSDRIAVMGKGQIEQTGTRDDILNKPNSKYVAEFLGINVYTGKAIHDPSGRTQLDINGVKIFAPPLADSFETDFLITIKPEDVTLSPDQHIRNPKWSGCTCNILMGTIVEITLMRSMARVTVDVGFPIKSELTLSSLGDLGLAEGENVCAQFKVNAMNVSPRKNPDKP